MQILFINQFFWPDTAATGQLLTDIARQIDPKLHEVKVLCGKSQYGELDTSLPPPVAIVRCGGLSFSRSKVGRLVSYASFFLCAAIRSICGSRPALVVTMTTPPLISLIGTILKVTNGARHFSWEMDLYPDIAVDLKVLKQQSVITKLVGWLADISRKRADGIIALGEEMKERLVSRGIPEDKIFVAENWAGAEIRPLPFPDGRFVLLYSGTFGLAHEQHTIAEAIWQLRNDDRFQFLFVGGGARRATLEQFCHSEGIRNVEFRSYASRSELGRSLGEGHVGLITQMPETLGAVVPSKTYGIMAAGRPILYVGPQGATPARVLERYGCGWRVEPGDGSGLVQRLRYLEKDRVSVQEAGVRARRAFEKHYDREIGVERIVSILGLSKSQAGLVAVGPAI